MSNGTFIILIIWGISIFVNILFAICSIRKKGPVEMPDDIVTFVIVVLVFGVIPFIGNIAVIIVSTVVLYEEEQRAKQKSK